MNKEYRKRIDRVLRYIETNLADRISLADVANVSHFSPYHFHRIFSGIVGETVNDYIARRRIERAVNLLVFRTELSITRVAMESGFSSGANFAKAVKLHFGFSPSEIRDPGKVKNSKIGKISSKYGKAFNPSDLYPDRITNQVMRQPGMEDTNMKIEVRELDRQRVCTLASERGYEPGAIYQAWDRLTDWATCNGVKPGEQKRFAFAFDNPTITPLGV